MTNLRTSGLLLLLLASNTTQAATLIVDAAGGGDYLTVEAAAMASAPGDIIDIAPGTYVENSGWSISHSLTFTSTSGGVVIQPAETVFDGGLVPDDVGHIFYVEGGAGDIHITFSNLIVDGAEQFGHITFDITNLYAFDVSLTIQSCSFIGATGIGQSPGISASNTDVLIEDSYFAETKGYGQESDGRGAVLDIGFFTVPGLVTINRTDFVNNSHTGDAGALHISNANANITDTSFISNNGGDEGGDLGGGAVLIQAGSIATFTRSHFSENTTPNTGGAVQCIESSCEFIQSEFFNNSASSGGAVYGLGSDLSFTGNVLMENFASSNGGAIGGELARSPMKSMHTLMPKRGPLPSGIGSWPPSAA